MRTLAIDIETWSSVSLPDSGVYRYAESEDFEILLFGYAFDNDEVQVCDFAMGEQLPPEVFAALTDPNVLKTAFNAPFERTCINRYFHLDIPADQWSCTAVMARELGLPNSLADVGTVIGLPEDEKKLKTGRALIRYFSVPCSPTKVNNNRTRNLPQHDMAKWNLYKEYNKQDVITERAIRKRLEHFAIVPSERKLWVIDQAINDRGVQADIELAENAVGINTEIKDRLLLQAQELTGLNNPKSTSQIKDWIQDQTGLTIESLNKKAMPEVRRQIEDETVHALLDIRAQLSKTSTQKYDAILRTACKDGRIRGLTMFYGAARTGRWAGRLVQMQNLPQNKMPDSQLDIARQLVKLNDMPTLELLFDNISDVLSQLIRTAFIPKPGYKFIVSDFSAIEARVLAWLANEQWRLDVFNTHGKIYEASAEQMFNLPKGSVKKGDPLRQKGKIAELALGYGGSVGAMVNMGALEMGLTQEELQPIVDRWRGTNQMITKFWWDTDAAARNTIKTSSPSLLPHDIRFYREGPFLRLKLPNGRSLSYIKPRVEDKGITYEGVFQKTGGWGRVDSYGPKLVENIVQATARDCLAESMFRLEEMGIPIVFHVHDEVICEVPQDAYTAEDIAAIMSQPISWAPGLPMKADSYECEYYRKD